MNKQQLAGQMWLHNSLKMGFLENLVFPKWSELQFWIILQIKNRIEDPQD